MRHILLTSFLLLGTLAVASAQSAPPPSDPMLDALGQDWQAGDVAERHRTDDVQRLVQAYRSLRVENQKLKDDATAAKASGTAKAP